jgi:bifunctional N-acetylglucosamine-1-phosphate-uridyltransferase/glucosamine-1-phosphate-acetyltransferase GlmU-like protein
MPDSGNGEGVASIVLAAGKGSRMLDFVGNKTLLPLIPGSSLYQGERPMLLEVLDNLPPGPKGIVVHHCADAVKQATAHLAVRYLVQPVTNGTGGALLAARPFLEDVAEEAVLITMGDAPLIRAQTYRTLLATLDRCQLGVLAFAPSERAQYGMLEIDSDRVHRIVEWKYWRDFGQERQAALQYCNAGVYAVRRSALVPYLERLAAHPHSVRKQRGDVWETIEEYFLTDLVEMMSADGIRVGYGVAAEDEVMGVDTPEALRAAQRCYAERLRELAMRP